MRDRSDAFGARSHDELDRAPVIERPTFPTFEARVERVEPLVAKGDVRLTLAPLGPSKGRRAA